MWKYMLIVLALFLSACGASGPASQPGTGTDPNQPVQVEQPNQPVQVEQPNQPATGAEPGKGIITVDTVEVTVAESMPVQVFVNVKGYMGDGCTSLGEIKQERTGNTINVTINANHSGSDVCAAMAPQLDERILLQGEFAAGEYVVNVNGVEHKFNI